jgi:hypothetical protein
MDMHRSRVGNETAHPLTLEHRRALGSSTTSLRTATSKRSFRKRTGSRCALHPDFNRLSTAGHLCCADVSPRGSIDCYRVVAAAGRRAGCAGSQTAGATLARIRLPAGLSAATEQQRSSLLPESFGFAHGAPRPAPLVYRSSPKLLRVRWRPALFRPAWLLRRSLQWRQLRPVLDADADRADLELRLIELAVGRR